MTGIRALSRLLLIILLLAALPLACDSKGPDAGPGDIDNGPNGQPGPSDSTDDGSTEPPTAPAITIDSIPETLFALDGVSGEVSNASGWGIAAVEISVYNTTDRTYWSGDSWQITETWLDADGLSTWSCDTGPLAMFDGSSYRIDARCVLEPGSELDTGPPATSTSFTCNLDSPNPTCAVSLRVPEYDAGSRTQQMVLKVTDGDGNPLSGAQVAYRQVEHDFILGLGPAEHTFDDDNRALVKAMGVNGAFGIGGLSLEPDSPPPFDYSSMAAEALQHHNQLNTVYGVEHIVADVGIPCLPCFISELSALPGGIPDWMQLDDIEGFVKPLWQDYFESVLSYHIADLYLIPGAPLTWLDTPERMQENWDLLTWEITQIRSADPDARIAVSITAGCHGSDAPIEDDPAIDFLELMLAAGVNPDVLGVEYHPGHCGCPPDLPEMEAYYNELAKLGRELYIWETYACSSESQTYPDPGWYSEEWQAETMAGTVALAFENPLIIGVNFLHFGDFIATDEVENLYEGFIRIDGTPKPSYYQTQEYWLSTFPGGEGTTDAGGEIAFDGCSGVYQVIVQGESHLVTV